MPHGHPRVGDRMRRDRGPSPGVASTPGTPGGTPHRRLPAVGPPIPATGPTRRATAAFACGPSATVCRNDHAPPTPVRRRGGPAPRTGERAGGHGNPGMFVPSPPLPVSGTGEPSAAAVRTAAPGHSVAAGFRPTGNAPTGGRPRLPRPGSGSAGNLPAIAVGVRGGCGGGMAGAERTRVRPPLHDGPVGSSAKSARDPRAAAGSAATRADPRVGSAWNAARHRRTSEDNPRVRVRRREAPVPHPVRPVRPAIRDAPPEAAVVGVVRVAPSQIEREVRGIAIPFPMTADGITNTVRLHRPGGGGDIIAIPRPQPVDERAHLRIRRHGTGCRPDRPDTDRNPIDIRHVELVVPVIGVEGQAPKPAPEAEFPWRNRPGGSSPALRPCGRAAARPPGTAMRARRSGAAKPSP